MKIAITAESKKIINVYEMPNVRKLIEDFKEDVSAKEYAEQAARIASESYVEKVFEASASISKNSRVWNLFYDESGNLDVWVEFTALTGSGFVMGGVYLSDLWQAGSDNYDEIRNHMFIRMFTETK